MVVHSKPEVITVAEEAGSHVVDDAVEGNWINIKSLKLQLKGAFVSSIFLRVGSTTQETAS